MPDRDRVDRDHLCHGCRSQAVDHAIGCPWLGVIASSRCKRYQRMPLDRVLDAMHFGSRNGRKEIVLRSRFFADVFETGWTATRAAATGELQVRRAGRLAERNVATGDLLVHHDG